MKLTAGNKLSWLVTVWKKLPSDMEVDEWDDLCTAMAWIAEELGVDQETLFDEACGE